LVKVLKKEVDMGMFKKEKPKKHELPVWIPAPGTVVCVEYGLHREEPTRFWTTMKIVEETSARGGTEYNKSFKIILNLPEKDEWKNSRHKNYHWALKKITAYSGKFEMPIGEGCIDKINIHF